MAKKKKPAKKAKKVAKPKKVRATKSKKAAAPKALKEKVLGKVDHFFDKISVAAFKVKSPFKVGDVIHVKGHTTDFLQRIDSIQINHQNVTRVKKGDEVGIKVASRSRENDLVCLADKKIILAQPILKTPAAAQPSTASALPLFAPAKPPASAKPPAPPPQKKKPDSYGEVKFLKF